MRLISLCNYYFGNYLYLKRRQCLSLRTAWVVILMIVCEGFLTPQYAQESVLRKELSVNYHNATLKYVLDDISKKAGIEFSYNPGIIPLDTAITYKCNNLKITDIFSRIFDPLNVEFEYLEEHVILRPATPKEIIRREEASNSTKKKLFTVSGFVTDAQTHESLIGATVYEASTQSGIATNNYGYFSLSLPEGEYVIQTSYLGYGVSEKRIDLRNNIKLDVQITNVTSMVDEIVVTSNENEDFVFNALAAQTRIEALDAQRQTSALGETDLLKSFDNLPGISFQSDGSSYFYVRGGNRDQNLILLDEAPIYNPSHMLGLFTPIIPDVIKNTNIYKADFPVEYGGRLSSIIDIRTRDGNMERFSGSATFGLVSSRFSLEGPIVKQKSSYFISFRRSYVGALIKGIYPSVKDFYFYDFTAKFNTRIGKRDRLFLTLYKGNDKFINEETVNNINGLEWGNSSATLRWNHVYGEKLFSNTTFYTSRYNYYLHTDYSKGLYWNSLISGAHLKTEFTWYLRPGNRIKFGAKYGYYYFNPGNHNSPGISDKNRVSPNNSGEFVVYAGDEINITDRLMLNWGLRFTNWSNMGEAFVVRYDNHRPVDIDTYAKGKRYYSSNSVEPRVSFSYKTGQRSSLKLSYNRTRQNINLINNSISPFNTLEVWLPAGPNIKPQKADIFNLGFNKYLSSSVVELNTDVFYKVMYNQIGYNYHANTLLNAFLEGELRQGKGKAYGFELLLRKKQGKLTGQVGYSFTRSTLKINELNNNREFKARQDKPVDLSLGVNYLVTPRWLATTNFLYHSGLMTTTPTSFYSYRGTQVPVYAEQNNSRLPDYKRLDIGSDFKLNRSTGNFEHHLVVSIYNVLGFKNPAFLYFTKTEEDNGDFVIPTDKLNLQKQVITQRYIFSVMPSITYKLSF